VFVREFAIAEFDDGDERDLHFLIGRRDTGQHPWHFLRVGEREDHFVNELICANGARNGRERRIGRHGGNEILRIELTQGVFADTASHDWDVVDIRVLHHGCQRGFRVTGSEFMCRVLFPQST